MNLEYEVIYSNRKTLSISVERDRSVVVRAPSGTPMRKIEEAVEKKRLWLYEKTRHAQKYDPPAQSQEFVSGSSILYLGKYYRLDVSKTEVEGVVFDGRFIISRAMLPLAADLMKAWYIEQAKRHIITKVKLYANSLGIEYNRILVSDLKYRWGSCTPKNNLNFNWRLIKAPMSVIEYIIIHELAHLLEPNHTARFWQIIKTQSPNYLRAKEWLKRYGSALEEKV